MESVFSSGILSLDICGGKAVISSKRFYWEGDLFMHARSLGLALFTIILCGCSGDPSAEIDKHLANLQSQDAVTRRNAVIALGNMGADAAQAVPALARMLNDKNDDIRVTVCQVLGKIGPGAAPALKALEKAKRNDPDDRVKAAAAEAMDKIKAR